MKTKIAAVVIALLLPFVGGYAQNPSTGNPVCAPPVDVRRGPPVDVPSVCASPVKKRPTRGQGYDNRPLQDASPA